MVIDPSYDNPPMLKSDWEMRKKKYKKNVR